VDCSSSTEKRYLRSRRIPRRGAGCGHKLRPRLTLGRTQVEVHELPDFRLQQALVADGGYPRILAMPVRFRPDCQHVFVSGMKATFTAR
jgi:hypothetical protein